ncbi:conserved oligomeric Golgi complex subunit 5 [Neocloeon triangulifer]|uniref:conserved oligomeric Golgi complex subunit 5 n=1 Tax=Neocloeon triangulifer TaxID=2078957 RepID=UPI00286F6096|nr:conserved oligomeric Golgi complex subunit 5 [Neocloeon triangulifer]
MDFWETIEKDDFFKAFLEGADEGKIHEQISKGLLVADQLAKLSEGIGLLDKELMKQVTDHYEDLISQATCIEKLEDVLNVMQPHIQYLLVAVDRLSSKIVEPYNKIQCQTRMLNNLHATSDLLRRGVRISQLIKRLQNHIKAGPQELTKAAKVLSELDEMSSDVDLTHLEAIDKDLRLSRHHRADVDRQARQLLIDGLASQNQTQVENALLVFHNLGLLQNTLKQVMSSSKEMVASKLRAELDFHSLTQQLQPTSAPKKSGPGGPGRAPLVTPGKSAEFRSSLWGAIEKSLECVFVETKKAATLQKQLSSSSILTPHAKDIDSECSKFWDDVLKIFGEELSKASQSSIFIQQTLEGEYPKLIKQYLEMCNRMQAFNSQQKGSLFASGSAQQYTLNRKVVNSFENAYLARSMSRLFDPVNNMFTTEDGIPSHDSIDNLLRTVLNELTVSMVDSHLNKVVASNVANTIKLLCTKCEHQAVTGTDAIQFIEAPTSGQLLNASLVDILHYFTLQTKRRVGNINGLSSEASTIIFDALENCSSLAIAIIVPVVTAIESAVEAILLTMHNEDFSQNDDNKAEAPCSLYVKELQSFLSRVSSQYLTLFKWSEVVAESVKPAAERCLDLFVRLACLVRPLGSLGRLKLAADFTQMEMAIGFLSIPSELGRPYRMLRSLKPLLFQTPEDISKCPMLGDILPHSLVLTLLFAFGPNEMQSPHVSAGWSVKFYSNWLDENKSERKRLELIDGALQGYAKAVSASGKTSYHFVYPIMVELLQAGSAV